ncbi:hypothetical protein ACOMHN_056607 [Nucella lapillus]
MGIHGLTSFIDNNPHLLKDHQLHDCRVVIDGNNLYHFLYFYCNVRFQFGGDYDIFQRKINMIFSLFKSCNIEAFVVFDGAYTTDGKKFRTTLSRARDRVYAAQRILNGHRGVLIPCLAQLTFKQALDKLGIPHVTCDFEADNQLVTLANQWNCPVVSNDSDFYIFDLSGGFIPLDYIDFRLHHRCKESSQGETTGTCLPVQYYHVDEFIKCFKSLNRSVLPLFATMLGNDYVNAAAFEAFYQKTPKIASRRYTASKKHHKIVSVLYWLEERQHEEELVSQVLSFIRPERRQHVQKLLSSSISGYLDTQDFESFDLQAFLEGKQTAASQNTDLVISCTGKCLAPWFVAACRRGKVPVFLLNAVLLHHVILPTQVESKSLPASFTTSRAIREVIYGLLLGAQDSLPSAADMPPQGPSEQTPSKPSPVKIRREDEKSVQENQTLSEIETTKESTSDNDTETSENSCQDLEPKRSAPTEDILGLEKLESRMKASSVKNAENGIVEYTRHNMELWRITVPSRVALPTVGNLPSLEAIPTVGQEERMSILRETLGVTTSFVSRFDPSLQLYMMCLVFWAKNAEPAVSRHLLKGIVLSAVLLHVHREIADRENQVIEDCIVENRSEDTDREAACSGDGTSASVTSQPSDLACEHPEKHRSDPVQKTKAEEGFTVSISGTCHTESDKVLNKVRDNLKKYYHDPSKIGSKNPPVHEIFQGSAQFLACLLNTVHLNSLLCCPLSTPHPASFFNGSFMYTIVHELKERSNPDMFLSEMLVKGSSLTTLFDCLCSAAVDEAGEVFAEKHAQGRKCCKSAKKKKKKGQAAAGTVDRGESVEAQTAGGETAFCDFSNRFGALLLEDDS